MRLVAESRNDEAGIAPTVPEIVNRSGWPCLSSQILRTSSACPAKPI
ncbi:MAG: hypothetical protein ACRD21_08395 [Vicinamibacteria bacterium]